jgi:plastocyanin
MTTLIRGRARRCALAAIAVAPLALGACGGDDGGSSDATAPEGATVVVEALNLKFDKKDYTATAGDQLIAYLGIDSQKHTLIVADASDTRIGREAAVTGGEVDTIETTLEAGTYSLICTVPGHAAAGMTATLTVS